MKKIFQHISRFLDFILSFFIDWISGIIIWLFITILSFLSWLILGKQGVLRFYKGFSKGIKDEELKKFLFKSKQLS